jgi:hypothetical protein
MRIRIIKKHFKRDTGDGDPLTFGEVGKVTDAVADGLIDQGYAEQVESEPTDVAYDGVSEGDEDREDTEDDS